MRKKRRKSSTYSLDRRLLFGILSLILVVVVTINCTSNNEDQLSLIQSEVIEAAVLPAGDPDVAQVASTGAVLSADLLWADVSDVTTSPRPSYRSSSLISLNVSDANLLDILTLLAYKLDVNIIYLEDPVRITVKTENLTPLDTFQIILQKQGLDYVQVGRNYVVGQSSRLQQDFSNRLVLTRFKLKYVTAEDMERYISILGTQVLSLTVDSNQKSLWVKGTPMAVGEARELANALDIKENESLTAGESFFVRLNLNYVVASEMRQYLTEIGVPLESIIVIPSNHKAIWLQGVSAALNQARDLIKALDIEENQSIAAGDPYLARFDLNYVTAENMKRYFAELAVQIRILTVEANPKTMWIQGVPHQLNEARDLIKALDIKENESLVEGDAYFVRITLLYVQAEAMADYLNRLNIPVDNILTIDGNQKAIWLQGTPLAINKAREMINALDIRENASITEGEEFFIRVNLSYVSASDMKTYLTELNVPVQNILVVDSNQKAIWIQGTSRAINSANELIRALDILENQSVAAGAQTLFRFDLKYVSAEDMARHLEELGVGLTMITVDSNQRILWLQGTMDGIARANELIIRLDIPENASLPDESQYVSAMALEYVSATNMAQYLIDLGIPAESLLVVPDNQGKIWVRGTPKVIADTTQMIDALDLRENAAFGIGGRRIIRMPVAQTRSLVGDIELANLIQFLSVLLDGLRSGDTGWITWDHPTGPPTISMDWQNPVILANDIRLKVSPNYGTEGAPLHYLIAEGTPDNVAIVKSMIAEIAGTPDSPFSAVPEEEENGEEEGGGGGGGADFYQPLYVPSAQNYSITARCVPADAGTISGARSYSQGSTATITVTPAEGYTFVRWIESGASVSTSTTYSFSVFRDRFLEAVFVSSSPSSPTTEEEE